MQTVSQPMGKRLQEAGWRKETYWVRIGGCLYERSRLCSCKSCSGAREKWSDMVLPAPTLDEVLEELSLEDFMLYFNIDNPKFFACDAQWQQERFKWLYTTMRSVDAAAEVWIKVKGSNPCASNA